MACALSFGALGCAASLGPSGARALTSDGATSVGGKLSARGYVWGDAGLVLGVEQQVLARLDRGAGCCDQWRASAVAGYGDLPLAYEGRVGFELVGMLGMARIPIGDVRAFAFSTGVEASLPIRVSSNKAPWSADELVGFDWEVVPDVTLSELWPTQPGVDHALRTDVALGLAVRLHMYSGALQ